MQTDAELQQLILGIATEGFWDLNLPQGQVFLSPRYCELTGYKPGSDVTISDKGYVALNRIPDEHRQFFDAVKRHLDGGGGVSVFSYRMHAPDKRELWIESRCRIVERDSDGGVQRIVGSVANITSRMQTEQDLQKLNRALLAISACNESLLHADNEQKLLQDICRIVVETGGYRMAWVGYAEDDKEQRVRPVAQAGFEDGYVESLNISWADTPRGQGPAGRAIRIGRICSSRNMHTDPLFAPWRSEAEKRGYASAQSFPLTTEYGVFGALTIYSALPDAFTKEETSLLTTFAGNLSYGISMLRNRKERELFEGQLRQSEARYRSLFENKHTVMLIIDPADGQIVDANPAAVSFYGWGYDELCARKITQINVLSPSEIIREMDRSKRRECSYFMFRHQLADGSIRDVEVVSGPISIEGKSLLYSIINDVTERKKAEKLLLESNKRMHFILRVANAGLWESDVARERSVWSEEIWPLYGLEPYSCEPSFENWLTTVLPEDRDRVRAEALETVDNGADFNCVCRVRHQDGSLHWLMSKGTPYTDEHGKVLKYVGIVIDITDRKVEEEKKRQLESSLRKSQRLETIGTLAGGIAHDFNNILTPILGYAELGALALSKTEPLYDYFTEIKRAAERASNMISQILTFSRAQESSPVVMRLQTVITEAMKLLRPSIPSSITIIRRIDPSCSNILADPSQMHQVILNLCTNAFQAMELDGGIMTIALRELMPDEHLLGLVPKLQRKKYVELSISDTGIGMDEATMERIFEPFFSTKSVNKGTGLGLSVVHGIVANVGGEIWAESQPGKGSVFRIYLPVSAYQIKKDVREPEVVSGSARLLFVDDELATLKMVTVLLGRLGYHVQTANSPLEAFELFQEHPERFDLVITDLTMPEMNGLELSSRLREISPELPVILVTGYGKDIEATPLLSSSGIRTILKKPVSMITLVSAINEIVATPGS